MRGEGCGTRRSGEVRYTGRWSEGAAKGSDVTHPLRMQRTRQKSRQSITSTSMTRIATAIALPTVLPSAYLRHGRGTAVRRPLRRATRQDERGACTRGHGAVRRALLRGVVEAAVVVQVVPHPRPLVLHAALVVEQVRVRGVRACVHTAPTPLREALDQDVQGAPAGLSRGAGQRQTHEPPTLCHCHEPRASPGPPGQP